MNPRMNATKIHNPPRHCMCRPLSLQTGVAPAMPMTAIVHFMPLQQLMLSLHLSRATSRLQRTCYCPQICRTSTATTHFTIHIHTCHSLVPQALESFLTNGCRSARQQHDQDVRCVHMWQCGWHDRSCSLTINPIVRCRGQTVEAPAEDGVSGRRENAAAQGDSNSMQGQ